MDNLVSKVLTSANIRTSGEIAERAWLLSVDEKRARLIVIASSNAFGNVGVKLFFWDGRHLKALTAPGRELWRT